MSDYFIDNVWTPVFRLAFLEECGVFEMDDLMEEVAFEQIELKRWELKNENQ